MSASRDDSHIMFEQRRWPRQAWVPIAAGLCWLWFAASFGTIGFLFSLGPGCLLLSSGVSTLLYPGDRRIPQFAALGGVIGVPLALPALFVGGMWLGVALMLLSAASFVAAGAISVAQEPHTDEVPSPVASLGLAAQVAIDDFLLAAVIVADGSRIVAEPDRVRDELHTARQLFAERGWLERPANYHQTPPPLTDPILRARRVRQFAFEHLEFDSGYEPHCDEPGQTRWLDRRPNRTAHAWVMRHRDENRPWLVCIHGYRMGAPFIDLPAFDALRLHHKHRLNLLLPILPLHGPRKVGRRSGDVFLAGDFIDTLHAEAQAMWDIRRLLSWVRAQGDGPVGVYGLSLGGYNTALLSCLDGDLACAIPGVPATDFTRLMWRHGPALQILYAERRGLVHDEVSEVLRVVSPLALEPLVPKERRYIFAGVADRLVPSEQVRDLWRHWGRPRIVWYQGAHVTFRLHREVDQMVMGAMREAGLIGASDTAA